MDRISISLLDANLLSLDTVLDDLQTNGIKRIHLDILDTSFVDNISFGPGLVNKILQYNFKFDVHIMVNYPLKIIKLLDLTRIDFVIIHWEAEGRDESIKYLKEHNCKIGLALNPDTSIHKITIKDISIILIMTVYPGFGGQSFISESIKKIDKLKHGVLCGVDGGVTLDNIHLVKNFDLIVIGSAYFKSKNKKEFLEKAIRLIS